MEYKTSGSEAALSTLLAIQYTVTVTDSGIVGKNIFVKSTAIKILYFREGLYHRFLGPFQDTVDESYESESSPKT